MKKIKKSLISFLWKLFVATLVLIAFTLLSLYPSFSYIGEARASVEAQDMFGYMWVQAHCNITYNPFIYTLTWLTGNGYYSGTFVYISKPIHYWGPVADMSGDRPLHILSKTPEELEDEAMRYTVMKQLHVNVVFNFIFILLIALMGVQDLYLCMIIGAAGFAVGSMGEALVGFIPALVVAAYIKLHFGEGLLVMTWNFLTEKYKKRKITSEEILERIDVAKLPLFYRLVLRLPMLSMDSLSDSLQGAVWAIILPASMFLIPALSLLLLVLFPFPVNAILVVIVPSVVFVIFLRVILERFINTWNVMVGPSEYTGTKPMNTTSTSTSKWDMDKLMNEYIDMLKKRKEEKT